MNKSIEVKQDVATDIGVDVDVEVEDVARRLFLKGSAALGTGLLAADLGISTAYAASATEEEIAGLPRVVQEMVAPPFLPKHDQVAKGGPKVVEIRFVIEEKKMVLDDDGAEVWALTYNGSVPGPMVVCHVDDYVELTLVNPADNAMEHNIDFHASTGALGGGALTKVSPGEECILRFKATKAGTFVYHCAPGGVMIPYHVVHGMNGAIMVLPREGLTGKGGVPIKYDKAYYIGEQDYYLAKDDDDEYIKYDSAGEDYADSLEVMATLTPSHVVFNGAAGALTGENSLKADVGDTVLIIHSQANRDTRPHLIGGHGDNVWQSGSFDDEPMTNLETWFIAGGAAGCVTYTFKQPGVYAYVNHNLIEAVLKGAAAHFVVEGTWDDNLMKQVKKPTAI